MFNLLIAIGCLGAPSMSDETRNVNLRCGSYSLYVCLRALGGDQLTLADLEKRLGQPTPNGYSMGQLADAAQGYGFHALGVKTSVDRLQARPRPFICLALIDEAHFLVLADIHQGAAVIVDPPKHYELPLDTLRSRWDGTALLISTSELAKEEDLAKRNRPWQWYAAGVLLGAVIIFTILSLWRRRSKAAAGLSLTIWLPLLAAAISAGCRPAAEPPKVPVLHFKPFEGDLGYISKGTEPYVARFPFGNRGTVALRVKKISASCNCAEPFVSAASVAPGEDAEVIVKIDRFVAEERRVTVTLSTDDPLKPFYQLPLKWMTVAPVMFEPSGLDGVIVLAGEVVEREVKVVWHTGENGRAIECGAPETRSEFLSACWVGELVKLAPDRVERRLQVRIRGDEAPAAFMGAIELAMGENGAEPIRLPVRWNTRRLVEVSPADVYLGTGRPCTELEKTITVTAWQSGESLDVGGVDFVESDAPFKISLDRRGERATALRLTARLPPPPGCHTWNLRIEVIKPVQTEIIVPVRAVTTPAADQVATEDEQ